MKANLFSKLAVLTLALAAATSAGAASFMQKELPGSIRFEQYANGVLALWRMPTPGTSTFPSSTCTNLTVPPATIDITPRFIAVYMQAQSLNANFFYQYDTTTCQIISVGFDQ